MKKDLDPLMQARGLDAILVLGSAQHNPLMAYFTGPVHLGFAYLVKQRNGPSALFCDDMERDEAARGAASGGYTVHTLSKLDFSGLLKKTGGNYSEATALYYLKILQAAGVSTGRVGVYGKLEASSALAIFPVLPRLAPEIELVGDQSASLLLEAMLTKDEAEVERIRQMGQITVAVVGQVAEFLTSHPVNGDHLVKSSGDPLTIGEVKRKINLWLAERGADNPQGTIFAIGRDSAVPHSAGNPDDLLRLGQTIIFDIYPCEGGGGYYYDFTRTWCLGYAPDPVLAVYEDVRAVYQQIRSEMKVGAFWPDYHQRACDLFAQRGHPTICQTPTTQAGYNHGLGHGVGLNIHERPWHGKNATQADSLVPGVVITVEPGLYYPDQGLGVRLEDTVYVRPDGQFETLAEYPLDLVLPLKK